MTPKEFVIWLKGFVQAANNFSATPKQWDDIRDQLNKVELNENSSISTLNIGGVNSTVTYGRPEDSITYTYEGNSN